jgi:hypothetical protein
MDQQHKEDRDSAQTVESGNMAEPSASRLLFRADEGQVSSRGCA